MNLVSITGPESTGKSTLAEALAAHYSTCWVREYAREYLSGLSRPYEFEDIRLIAKEQYRREQQERARALNFLFCDTDFLVFKIWSEFKYGKADTWITSQVRDHRYDLYLLCDIDLPWVSDPLREHPHRRKELFDLYLSELTDLQVTFEVISGTGQERIHKAISAIEKTFMKDIQNNTV